MSVPPADIPASLSASGYEDGLGRRTLLFDRETGGILERLDLRPEFVAFERAIRERMELASAFEDERFANARSIERDPRTGVSLVSEFVPGNRLSDLLETLAGESEEAAAPGVDAALGFLLEVLPALTALHSTTGFTHGLVGPGRTVVTPTGEVVLLDWLFAHTLERLRLDRRRLWRDFGLAMPPAAGASRFDPAADVCQAALTGLMIVIGRPLRADEYPDGLTVLAAEVVEIAQIRGSAAFATGLQRFLHRALRVSGGRPFTSADEADTAVRHLADEIGIAQCRTALGAFVSEFNGGHAPGVAEPTWEADVSTATVRAPLSEEEDEYAETDSAALEVEIALDDFAAPRKSREEDEAEAVPYELSLTDSTVHVESEARTDYELPSPEPLPEPRQAAPGTELSFAPEHEAAPSSEAENPLESSAREWNPAPVDEAPLGEPAPDEAVQSATAPKEPQPAPVLPPLVAAPQPPPPAPKATPASRQKRRGAKRDRDKLRSTAKPAPPPVAHVAQPAAPTPRPGPPGPVMPYYPPVFDPREPASMPAVNRTMAVPAHLAAPPAPALKPAPAPSPVRVKSEPAPLRMKSDAPAGYAPAPRRGGFQESAEDNPQPYAHHGRPRLSPRQWKLGAAAALMLALGAGAFARPYLMDRPQAQSKTAAAPPARVVPKAATASAGSLSLVTQPAGARVLLDGEPAGETPLTIESVSAGRHTVTFVTAAGSVKKNVKVEAGKTASLDIPVYSGWVAVFAPVLLDISENGRSIGTTEQGRLMIAPGRHLLTFSNRELGYTSAKTVDIEPGEERSVNLQPTGEVNFNAIPWAEIWIDGQKTGDTPIANLQVALGTHEVVFKHPQLGERKLTTVVRANAPTAASVDFTKPPQP